MRKVCGDDFTNSGIEGDAERVRRDPATVSREDLQRLVKPAMMLCSAVEGLSEPAVVTPQIAARLLREPMLAMRQELVRIGVILPRGDR